MPSIIGLPLDQLNGGIVARIEGFLQHNSLDLEAYALAGRTNGFGLRTALGSTRARPAVNDVVRNLRRDDPGQNVFWRRSMMRNLIPTSVLLPALVAFPAATAAQSTDIGQLVSLIRAEVRPEQAMDFMR